MKNKLTVASLLGMALASFVLSSGGAAEKTHKITTISPRKMADALHAVIAADRAVYGRVIIERMTGTNKTLQASQNWQAEGCLPVHAQVLRLAATEIQKRGAEFSYALRSMWPINPSHGPQTAVEQTGLEFVAQNPGTNYYTEELLGGRSYFTAVYPDTAVLTSCADCHNRHPSSPRQDFKTNEVMGAIIVRVPLEF